MLADRDTNTLIMTLRSTTEVGVEILTRQSVCMIVGFFVCNLLQNGMCIVDGHCGYLHYYDNTTVCNRGRSIGIVAIVIVLLYYGIP